MHLSEYNRDQAEALEMVGRRLKNLSQGDLFRLRQRISSYLEFRKDVAGFQSRFFSSICNRKCFSDGTSACCGREGIATFFGDVVVNALLSTEKEMDDLMDALIRDRGGPKCVYLADKGCLWRLKPIVCEMFLCDHAKETVLKENDALLRRWESLLLREKDYTWPSRPVLFDELEEVFLRENLESPLMYFHKSPGLLRIKARAMEKPRSAT
jgi:hypothetical protein